MSTSLDVGVRVRVNGHGLSTGYTGALGTIEVPPDQFGRFGVRLDKFPRAKKHWLHWFGPDRLEPAPQSGTANRPEKQR